MLVTQRVVDSFDFPITCASFARFLRPNPEQIDPRYLYWFLQALYQSGEIEQYQVQHTGIARFQYTQFAATQQVPLAEMSTQQAVSEVLGALDDKIAVNLQLSETTEQFLQAAYQGLVQGLTSPPVPVEGLVRRLRPKRKVVKEELLPQGDYPVFDQSDLGLLGYLNGDGYLEASAEEPVMYFGDHTCKLRIAARRFTVGPNTVPFIGNGIPTLTLYCALNGLQNHEEYKRHWQLLMKKEVSLPEAHVSAAFASRQGHLLNLLISLSRENTKLAAIRDALLPQLMSGKLRVKDAEKVLEGAGV
jgi:type I restriction enzyme S subunit